MAHGERATSITPRSRRHRRAPGAGGDLALVGPRDDGRGQIVGGPRDDRRRAADGRLDRGDGLGLSRLVHGHPGVSGFRRSSSNLGRRRNGTDCPEEQPCCC